MLCYVMLCHIMLSNVMLCYVVSYYVTLCDVILYRLKEWFVTSSNKELQKVHHDKYIVSEVVQNTSKTPCLAWPERPRVNISKAGQYTHSLTLSLTHTEAAFSVQYECPIFYLFHFSL